MFKNLVILIFPAFLSVIGNAQKGTNYRIQQFTTENGMPSNGVKGLKWDEATGFLWIATEAGVARFNGLDISIFNKENTPGFMQERMAYIVKNNAGKIYTSDAGENVFAVSNSLLKHYESPLLTGSFGYRDRYCFSVTNAVLKSKILSLAKQENFYPWIKMLEQDDSSCVIIDANHTFFYISSAMAGFKVLTVPESMISGMMIEGNCFLLDNKGMVYSADKEFKNFAEKKIITVSGEVLKIEAGKSIVYWDNGMKNPILFAGRNAWLLHDRSTYIEASLICSAVPSFSYILSAQYSEKNKTLFIGTDSKGIIVINENRVESVKQKKSAITQRNSSYSQVELNNGNVLTNEGHIIGSSPGISDIPIKDKFNFTTHTSGDSLLWYGQIYEPVGNCLHRYNYHTKQTTVFSKIGVREVFAVVEAVNGSTYIVKDDGLGVFQKDSIHYLFKNAADKIDNAPPFKMEELSPGIFAVASCNGLIRYNTNTLAADTILSLPGYCVRALWKYRDYLFIGTYGKGYYIYRNGVLKAMPLDKNRFLLHTHCFMPDEYGFCWISTNRGLFKAQLSDIINSFEKNIRQVYYHYFGKNDGMDITEMNGGCAPCALLMKNEIISFPTMDGLLWVNPAKANPLLPEGNIYIDEFRAGDKQFEIPGTKNVSLSSQIRDVFIRISFSAWCNKENIYLDYKLNDSRDWTPVDITGNPEIKFSNLSPGDYKLVLRKINGFGTDNYSYNEINFSIGTPWNQQWWFYLLIIFAVAGMIILYLRFRTRQFTIRQRKLERQVEQKTKELKEQNEVLEKNNTIKTRLISIISHDIVTPLKFLTVAGKNLVDNKEKMPLDLQQETIKEMANTSQELQLLSTNILNWIKYQNENRRLVKEPVNVKVLTNQVISILTSIAKSKGIQLKNEIDSSLIVHQYGEPMKILFYNLATNAINFSDKGSVVFRSKKKNDTVILSVKDRGMGMTADQVKNILSDEIIVSSANVDNRKGNGLGYLIIKDLLKMMEATIHIESTKGEGSTISIFIPV